MRAEWAVLRKELGVLASCCLSRTRRNSSSEEWMGWKLNKNHTNEIVACNVREDGG